MVIFGKWSIFVCLRGTVISLATPGIQAFLVADGVGYLFWNAV